MLALDEQVRAFVELYNWVRPHEALGFVAPMVRYLAEPLSEPAVPNLSEPERCRFLDAEHQAVVEGEAGLQPACTCLGSHDAVSSLRAL